MKKFSEEQKNMIPMNLQLFAENINPDSAENPEPQDDDGGENPEEDKKDETLTVEELMTQLAKERAEKAKLKNSFDEASSEAAKYKRQLREKQTAKEIEDEEKQKEAEAHKAYVAELENFKKKAEAKARWALLGMSEDLATKAAEAEVKGDMDELASVQKKHQDALLKQKEKEWLKSRPDINAGNGELDDKAALEKQIEEIMLRGI